MNTDPTQCTAFTPADARNQQNRQVRAGYQCELDKQHDGHHWTREVYLRGDDPKHADGVTFAPYEWDGPPGREGLGQYRREEEQSGD